MIDPFEKFANKRQTPYVKYFSIVIDNSTDQVVYLSNILESFIERKERVKI